MNKTGAEKLQNENWARKQPVSRIKTFSKVWLNFWAIPSLCRHCLFMRQMGGINWIVDLIEMNLTQWADT